MVSMSGSGGPPLNKPVTHCTECQTDLTADEIEYLITELEECRKKAKILEEKLENKKRLKRDLIIEDVLRDAESVKFYTGLPNLACFNQHGYAYWLKSSMGLYFGGHLVKELNANFPSLSRNTQIPG